MLYTTFFSFKALESSSLTCAELLLRYGADISVQDNNGISVMHVASLADNTALMKLLWKNNANLNVKDKVFYCNLQIIHLGTLENLIDLN